MGTAPLPYNTLEELLADMPIVEEDPDTREIIRRLRHVRTGRELSRSEFLEICRWKSPRSTRHCTQNTASEIRKTCREVFHTRSERQRIELLTTLHGVGVPTASAILTLTNPRRYGVMDVRVWQLLYALGSVNERPGGQGFGINHWLRYLEILRTQARRVGAPVRLVELTLFRFHRNHQSGMLYSRSRSSVGA